MGSGAERVDEREGEAEVDEPSERERAVRATALGLTLGTVLALLGRRRA
jgi:hypothetical protein